MNLTLIEKTAGVSQESRREQNENLVAIQDLLNTLESQYAALYSSNVKFTSVGGVAVKMVNRTGAPSVKGYVVTASSNYDGAVQLTAIGGLNPIGVFLESGVADGADGWVVVSGIGEVYFSGSTTRGHIARIGFSDDTGEVAGQVISEPYPTNPFATDKHFAEVGHVIESRTGAGLAKAVLHFN